MVHVCFETPTKLAEEEDGIFRAYNEAYGDVVSDDDFENGYQVYLIEHASLALKKWIAYKTWCRDKAKKEDEEKAK
ncbi:MAG: hypothetical protein IJH78_03965 [Clostridia bacterium]|nr:hypothetical protein [Clostridia bacterium]